VQPKLKSDEEMLLQWKVDILQVIDYRMSIKLFVTGTLRSNIDGKQANTENVLCRSDEELKKDINRFCSTFEQSQQGQVALRGVEFCYSIVNTLNAPS
jgi:hypothetical protein